jgi:cytochrome oxidase assembly protein ShyY1
VLAASIRAFASSNECGAPRCLPTASALGGAVLGGGVVAVAGAACATGDGLAGRSVDAGASTVTVTVRRGAGRSLMPHAESASTTATAAPSSAVLRDREGRRGVTFGMASKSVTDRPSDHGAALADAAAARGPLTRVTYSGWVLRRLLSPKWVGLFAVVVVAVAACTMLGLWQLGVARDEGHKQAVAAASQLQPAPLQQVTRAHAPFSAELSNRPVSVTGSYDDSRTILVIDRRLGERAGSWVVTPLVTQGGTVAVLRGFVDGVPATPPAAPTGVVTVEGSLGPTESPRPGSPLPAPQRRSVDLAVLVNEWPGDLYNVLVLASSEKASTGSASAIATPGLTRVPPPDLDTPLNLRNAAYAVQWWVFGLFAIWMWWKMFRAEQQAEAEPAAEREEIPA